MTPPRDRSFLGILSVILLISTAAMLSSISAKVNVNSAFSFNLFSSIISIFNIVIISGWIAFGGFGGIPLTIISLLLSFLFILRADFYKCSIFTLPFFITTFVGYAYSRMIGRIDQSYNLKSEKLVEEINILVNDIENAKDRVKALDDKLARYSTLKEVIESLSTDLSLDDITGLLIDKAIVTLGKSGRVLLFLVDARRQELILSVSKNASNFKAKKGDIFDHWVLRNRRSLIIEDITKDFRFPADEIEKAREGFISLIETPLVSENKVIGILRMDSPKESWYTHDDLRLLDIVSDLGAAAIDNALLYSRTQELAIRDGLTGLYVRRYFMERFKEELKRAAGKKDEISFLIMDIDHFKDYNDRYGHTAGDLVLKHLSRGISSTTREGDIAARYGGEEIAVVLLGSNRTKAVAEAEAIRKRIEDTPLLLRRHSARVTVSIGVSSYPQDAISEEDLIKIADERLYKAKKQGRNRVCSD